MIQTPYLKKDLDELINGLVKVRPPRGDLVPREEAMASQWSLDEQTYRSQTYNTLTVHTLCDHCRLLTPTPLNRTIPQGQTCGNCGRNYLVNETELTLIVHESLYEQQRVHRIWAARTNDKRTNAEIFRDAVAVEDHSRERLPKLREFLREKFNRITTEGWNLMVSREKAIAERQCRFIAETGRTSVTYESWCVPSKDDRYVLNCYVVLYRTGEFSQAIFSLHPEDKSPADNSPGVIVCLDPRDFGTEEGLELRDAWDAIEKGPVAK